METFEYIFISGYRISSELLYVIKQKQLYYKKNYYKNSVSYTCVKKKCFSKMIIKSGVCMKVKHFQEHNHGTNENEYEKLKILNRIKVGCSAPDVLFGNRKSMQTVFHKECDANQNAAAVLDYKRMERGLRHLKNNIFPKSPINCFELNLCFENDTAIMKNFGMTKNDQQQNQFFKTSIDTGSFSYCIFASDIIINLINNHFNNNDKNYLIDSEFKIIPFSTFQHFLVIYVAYGENVYPFIYVLMSSKSKQCYKHLFQYIHNNITALDGNSLQIDYDLSIQNAINEIYPNIKLQPSWYHFCLNIQKEINRLPSFFNKIKINLQSKKIYHKFLALSFLPIDNIIEAFDLIKFEINFLHDSADYDEFIKYFWDRWICREGPKNISVSIVGTRLSNAMEFSNDLLTKKLSKKDNFFKFVKILRDEEYDKTKSLQQIINELHNNINISRNCSSSLQIVKKRRYKDRFEKIGDATKQYQDKIITLSEYLNYVTCPKNQLCFGLDKFREINENFDNDFKIQELNEDRKGIEIIDKKLMETDVKACDKIKIEIVDENHAFTVDDNTLISETINCDNQSNNVDINNIKLEIINDEPLPSTSQQEPSILQKFLSCILCERKVQNLIQWRHLKICSICYYKINPDLSTENYVKKENSKN